MKRALEVGGRGLWWHEKNDIAARIKRFHLKVFMFISLCLASMRIKSAYTLGSVALAHLALVRPPVQGGVET